ncbi:MAG: NAD-dependent epimerase/dehydratase family protein [bacterium]|nr:NAD-dependent epimerase/dehydratase family protein [bacterium]
MRDLVTGAGGLVGQNLVRALVARGRRVRVLLRRPVPDLETLPGVEPVRGDITVPGDLVRACDGVEHVYHCAALVSMWERLGDAMWRTNVEGTDHVVAACRRAGVRRLIHCSSVDAIGLPEGDAPSTETMPWNWDRLGVDNPYARTKWESQRRVLAAVAGDLDAVVVNPAYMFGPWDTRPSSGRMILEVAAGRAIGWTSGGNNFVDVEDVVLAMIEAASRGVRGECYILGHVNLTYREIFSEIADALGVRPPRFAIPRPLARLGGFAGDLAGRLGGREPAVNSLTARLGYVRHYYDPTKATVALGLRRTPIREAIAKAAAWFRQAGMLR